MPGGEKEFSEVEEVRSATTEKTRERAQPPKEDPLEGFARGMA